MQPTFDTPRLRLPPRTVADLDACLAMDRDPEVTRFIPGPWADPVAHRAFVLARMAANHPEGLGYWTIRDRADGSFLGWVLLLPVEGVGDEIEIGWRLVRSAWGRGIAGEAAAPVLAYGLSIAGNRMIVADIDPDNVGSMRVAEKIGMTARGDRIVDGVPARRFAAGPDAPGVAD
ncbi:GNAT family N-acetyltransferase [Amorphus sp. MBR-141]